MRTHSASLGWWAAGTSAVGVGWSSDARQHPLPESTTRGTAAQAAPVTRRRDDEGRGTRRAHGRGQRHTDVTRRASAPHRRLAAFPPPGRTGPCRAQPRRAGETRRAQQRAAQPRHASAAPCERSEPRRRRERPRAGSQGPSTNDIALVERPPTKALQREFNILSARGVQAATALCLALPKRIL